MGWQDAVAIGVVLGAVLYLSSLGWKGWIGGKSSGCGASCGKCGSDDDTSAASRPEQLVSIGLGRAGAASQAASPRPEHAENS